MTFKHVKFQDSAVMRSLERVAKEKGLVKEEDLVKTASLSKKADLTPSDNLLENLLKLSSGLREAGFSKYADELEDKAFAYKQAQTLYETSKETGEDLVDAAHPKGSHKLEDVDGDDLATIETIIDQQLKDMEMVSKKPTGKLASTKDILKAVKIVLADSEEENLEAARQLFLSTIAEVNNLASRIMRNEDLSDLTYHSPMNFGSFRDDEEAGTGVATGTTKGHMEVLISNLNELSKKGPSQESVREIQRNINTLTSLVRDADNVDPVNRSKYTAEARAIYSKTPKILEVLRGKPAVESKPVSIPEVTVKATALSPLFGQLTSLKNKVSLWKSFRSIARNRDALNWIEEELKSLEDIDKRYSAVKEGQEDAAAPQMRAELSEEMTNINEFEKSWVKPAGSA